MSSGVWNLAKKILLHDRVKFAVASAGVSISVMLVLVQIGLYSGFMHTASTLIDHGHADVWVTRAASENFDFSAPLDDRTYYRVASTPGVAKAERMILAFAQLKLDSGGDLGVQIVGVEPKAELMRPWHVIAGDGARLGEPGAITVDRSEYAKLHIDRVGHRTEIGGARAEVVAMTDGIRSFTTSPLVFTDLTSARTFTGYRSEAENYVLVRVAPAADPVAVRDALRRIPNVDAYTTAEMSARTQQYWSSRTGVGAGFFTTAILGIIVGLVVVGQILYNGTLQHLREYGTLKAMGAKNGAVVRVIVYQALIAAVVGLVFGGLLAVGMRSAMKGANLIVALSPGLFAATAVVTVLMCAAASLLSIIKVLRLDPASVFKV
jgi:putative ABC transport system permease protein